jgi:HAD superfamily hydrolase (TIGR01549 family)
MGEPTVLFDLDGTLVDTNYLHTLAWRRALVELGHDVPTAWVHRCIGMGSSQLLAELVGDDVDQQPLKDAWRRHFEPLKPEIRALPGATDLVRAVAERGTQAVYASSSEEADVATLVEAVGAGDAVCHVTSAGEVSEAKPEPEVFQVALEQSGGDSRAVVVGDTVWDVQAAKRAGLACVGVLTGGVSRAELEEAGAVAVYRDPADLLVDLDQSPLAALLRTL